jgi:hypothetical protein
MFVVAYICYDCDVSYPSDPAKAIVDFQLYLAVFQFLTCIYLIFVQITPTNNTISMFGEGYFNIAPKIHALFAGLDFVVIPIFVILQSLIQFGKYEESYFTGSLWLYPLVSFVIVALWVPTQIVGIARSYFVIVPRRKSIRDIRGTISDWVTLKE